MPVLSTDFEMKKSFITADVSSNGGRMSYNAIASGVFHALFPRVPKWEREAGVTRYRKEFWWNKESSGATAYALLLFLEGPSLAGDRLYLAAGTQTDNQGTIGSPAWLGAGQLQSALTAGVSTTVVLAMEASDYVFPNGGKIHIADYFMASQTIAADVRPGDSVAWNAGASEWRKISQTEDVTYTNGRYLGNNLVMTIRAGTSHEEWLDLADNSYTGEVIGTGNGSNVTPTLTQLTHRTNGICNQPAKLPVITATCGGVARSVNISATGAASGYCSAGQLNMASGAWTTAITWTSAPDNSTNITAAYRENCFAWSGNNATVSLASGITPANSYATANTFGAGVLSAGDIFPSVSNWAESNTHAGTYDEATYPVLVNNQGAVEDSWTVTFTGSGAFSVSGANTGSVGTGGTGSNFAPTNPNTGQAYFTLRSSGWAGTWTTGDSITFQTHPSAAPIWLKQVIPAATSQEANNLVILGMS